jgi:hypothetical protein
MLPGFRVTDGRTELTNFHDEPLDRTTFTDILVSETSPAPVVQEPDSISNDLSHENGLRSGIALRFGLS